MKADMSVVDALVLPMVPQSPMSTEQIALKQHCPWYSNKVETRRSRVSFSCHCLTRSLL